MTVVVACWFLQTVAVIADCRVSYQGTSAVDDNLQKLYQIGDRMVLGFSGPLSGAHRIIERVRWNAQQYKKPSVAANLRTDLERWIRHEYREIENLEDRRGLRFLLVSVEPGRKARTAGKPDWMPSWPDFHMLVLRPSRTNPEKLVREEKGLLKIIGIETPEHQAPIRRVIQRFYGMACEYPREGPRIIADTLQYALMDVGLTSVGGLFQCALLSSEGIEWLGYRVGEVSLEFCGERYVQRNVITGQETPLRTIWEWCEDWRPSHVAGSDGRFEDPGLRRAVDAARSGEKPSEEPSC